MSLFPVVALSRLVFHVSRARRDIAFFVRFRQASPDESLLSSLLYSLSIHSTIDSLLTDVPGPCIGLYSAYIMTNPSGQRGGWFRWWDHSRGLCDSSLPCVCVRLSRVIYGLASSDRRSSHVLVT
jgi:hypothetical protein